MLRSLQLVIKRSFDVVVCVVLVVVLAPLFVVLALAVRWSSPGPVLFVQERAGRGGRPFRMIKFRTMTGEPNGDRGDSPKEDLARTTRIGLILRDYGLDELPQLFNILAGDMSVIGPRPMLPRQADVLPSALRRMFDMRPGVLSLAAVEGRRSIPLERRYELHAQYVNEWSLWLDCEILWSALFVVLGRKAARDPLS